MADDSKEIILQSEEQERNQSDDEKRSLRPVEAKNTSTAPKKRNRSSSPQKN
jgi:hypothetical protein